MKVIRYVKYLRTYAFFSFVVALLYPYYDSISFTFELKDTNSVKF